MDTKTLYNVQEIEDSYLKFVEPCPKVEWAGELNRDRHFVVNTNSNDTENLDVIVFNPMHGQSKFHNMTSDRLKNVTLYYREVGDLQWSKARTEIKNNDGSADSLTIDFAAEYAYGEESDYGYSSLKWALANKVPEGMYEIRVDAECDQLGGPADMDLYSTPILSGIIDLTPPEQYGRALPLQEAVLVGEEIAVVFTEPVRCEAFDLRITVALAMAVCGQSSKCNAKPQVVPKTSLRAVRCCSVEDKSGTHSWLKNKGCDVWAKSKRLNTTQCNFAETYDDAKAICEMNGARLCTEDELMANCARGTGCYQKNQLVWSSDPVPNVDLDRDPPVQIVCDGRKVGFQIDPTQINVEDWVGGSFKVEMGKINTANVESKSNIFDMNGNAIERNVKFEKRFADIDLEKASTSFTVTLNEVNNCSDVSSEVCLNEIKNVIALLLGLSSSDQSRIEVKSVATVSASTLSASIAILPIDITGNGRMLRYGNDSKSTTNTNNHSVSLFRELQNVLEKEQGQGRALGTTGTKSPGVKTIIVGVDDMKILPGDLDMKLLAIDPEMVEEEEELYRYASLKDNTGGGHSILNKIERQAMVEEIEKKERGMINEIESQSKSREEAIIIQQEAMMNEMKEESKSREDAMMNEMKESKSREETMMNEMKEESKSREDAMISQQEVMMNEIKSLHFELAAVTLACVGISLVAFLTLRRN